ncbi:hypothetical protein RJP21_18585 [Paenibacillus sp. VCA1]|uniref:hypothetical protein n=1 Tax=Paenibacillus sp. VCA1 TaxID=3039148 RepID=UPI00287121A9|nr:hypothetical protein [Paenibacillus sp. VCA1]MDR9855624.1 hypothetical protein [Paenibacillus sp. VCA1]
MNELLDIIKLNFRRDFIVDEHALDCSLRMAAGYVIETALGRKDIALFQFLIFTSALILGSR